MPELEVDAFRVVLVALNVVALWGLSLEAIHYFDNKAILPGDQNAINGTFLSLTAIWSVYGSLLLGIGLKWRQPLARWGGLALVAVAVLKLLLLDTFEVKLRPFHIPSGHQPALPDFPGGAGSSDNSRLPVPARDCAPI